MTVDKTIEDDLKEAMAAALDDSAQEDNVPDDTAVEEPVVKADLPPPDKAIDAVIEDKVTEAKVDAPISLSGAIKAKWHELPADVQAEWKKREDDIHRMMTAKEGELNLGRSIKEIATPYEAVIRSEGGTVEGAFKDLLNTAYVLRTGSPQQKAQLILQTAQQFGVDLRHHFSGQRQADPLATMQQEIQHLRQQADPERIKSQLQDEMDRVRINGEIQAFAANPTNVHFNAVKSTMGSLISSGRAKDLQEAYEMAIWSDPSIRSDLLKAQSAQEAEKKKAEMATKKNAAASVVGSPGMASPNANAPQKSIEDDIREQMRASSGKI